LSSESSKRYIHLIVGITGHRDIIPEDRDMLKKKIKEVFDELRNKLPSTPLLLLTPLAEGTDRLAAEVAIEENIDYIVTLPLSVNDYKTDFPDSEEEFDYYLKKALGHFEPPLRKAKSESLNQGDPDRDESYKNVGVFIVKHCQVLMTLWDGKNTGHTSGTSQIVNFQLGGIPKEYEPHRRALDLPDTGPVYHIPTRRKKEFVPSAPYNPEIKMLLPKETNGDTFFGKEGVFSKIDRFNKKIKSLNDTEIEKSRQNLGSSVIEKEKFISHLYAEADLLAIKHRKNWSRFQFFLFIAVAILFGLFLAYSFFHVFIFLVVYFLAYTAFAIFFTVKNPSHRHHSLYVEYRALAEGLRVEFFLRLAGLNENVVDYYLRKHKQHLQWVRSVMISANVFDPQSVLDLDSIKKYWIDRQYTYYSKSSEKNRTNVGRMRIIIDVLFFAGIVSIAVAIVLNFLHDFNTLSISTMLIVLLPFVAGLIETYAQRSAMRETAEEHSRMKNIYENAVNLWKVGDEDYDTDLIKELAMEALRENADWLLLHAQLPDEIPL